MSAVSIEAQGGDFGRILLHGVAKRLGRAVDGLNCLNPELLPECFDFRCDCQE